MKTRRIILLGLLGPLLADPSPTRAADRPRKVVCLGDSVTGVYYHTGSRRAYSDMLQIALRRIEPEGEAVVINAGISGNTTRDGLTRLERDVLVHKPTHVTVMFGLNDVTRVPLEEYRKNLSAIVDRCQAAGAEVILCTPNNVIETRDRPIAKLEVYCGVVRDVAKARGLRLCDVYAEMEAFRKKDHAAWRLVLSDEIHPNMDGHKRMASAIARTLTGKTVDLSDVSPMRPALPHVREKIAKKETIRVLAMPPYDGWVAEGLRDSNARIEVTPWPAKGLDLRGLEQDAKARVRAFKPDLVIVALPRGGKDVPLEQFIHDQTWIMNWSLPFGPGGWDCVVVHPNVNGPGSDPRDALVSKLIRAQDVPWIERMNGDLRDGRELFEEWFRRAKSGD